MPADRLLGTLLRSLQTYTDQQDTPRQLLSSPAIWAVPEGLRTCMRSLSVFHSAAQALLRHEQAVRDKSHDQDFESLQPERILPKNSWIKAVVKGADKHSPRWRHLLVIGGLLLGFGPYEDKNLSRGMRNTLETALATATNLALAETPEDDELGLEAITLVLNHCFPLLSTYARTRFDYDKLLPVLMHSILHSTESLQSGYFLGIIDLDVVPATKTHFNWSERSSSFRQVQAMMTSSLSSSLGPLARLIGHSIEQVKQSWLVTAALEDLEGFSRTIHSQWRQNKLSDVDPSEESVFLDQETIEKTTSVLWKLLQSTLFATVIILRSIVGRLMSDRALARDDTAPKVASQALTILRNLYFISTRFGATSFSQYTFVYLTSMDVLTTYPSDAKAFLQSIRPAEIGSVPTHPIGRNLDLFFLNTSEHFTLVLPTETTEEVLVAAATPYLAAGGSNNLLPIFEAAHSVMLAAFSAPQNADLASKHLPLYVDALFKVFPANLSARQFRVAFKTLIRITVPPSVLARSQPMLPAVLLEYLHERASQAGTFPLTPQPNSTTPDADSPYLSEQAVITLTVLDTLTELPLDLLDEYLPIAADMVDCIEDSAMREHCKQHFWHVLVDGEMDPDRSGVCHAWWSTGAGREMVLYGRAQYEEEEPGGDTEMSGALPSNAKESKL
nr:peroxisomal membrane protein pex17 [Quercus suber]